MKKSFSFADKVIAFYNQNDYNGEMPKNFSVINPFTLNPETKEVSEAFYKKFYNDNKTRKFIIGINPSRHGAGVTGVPFTDTKRLQSECGITMKSSHTHEISSLFMYDMITQFGGVKKFYSKFYINSPFPFAIVKKTNDDNWLNANYYDDKDLFNVVKSYMIHSLKTQIQIGLNTEEVFVLGKKNATFIQQINKTEKLFRKISILEHPRFIQQYKSKEKQLYINKYLQTLTQI